MTRVAFLARAILTALLGGALISALGLVPAAAYLWRLDIGSLPYLSLRLT